MLYDWSVCFWFVCFDVVCRTAADTTKRREGPRNPRRGIRARFDWRASWPRVRVLAGQRAGLAVAASGGIEYVR